MEEEKTLQEKAESFARANKKRLAKELTDKTRYAPDKNPVSVFMAGSPGAGKTEYSKNLIEILERNKKRKMVRIDGDEFRTLIPGYTGGNSSLFQGAISILVDRVHDVALEQKQTFLLDGTLSKYDKAVENISRSLSKGRPVFVFYVYQRPEVAWRFTQAREIKEGRNIPQNRFIEQFLGARETVERIRANFDERVTIFLVKKNFETHQVEDVNGIEPAGPQIDHYLAERYTVEDLKKLL